MIERYTRAEFGKLWSEETRFQEWFQVELAVLQTLEKVGKIPAGTFQKIRTRAVVRVSRIHELEVELKHDVLAFTTSISEQVGDEGRFFHYGLTSSDVVDTALSRITCIALDRILSVLSKCEEVLAARALEFKNLPCMGRTHGVHAQPSSFGLKFLGWLAEMRRQRRRLIQARREMAFGKLSGAVGAYGIVDPKVEAEALAWLGLEVEPVATQVLPRDRHALVISGLAQLAGSIERIALELRHLQRSEVREVEEEFTRGQKGSSAMPHKRNPISAENLSGCARLMRGYAAAALENVALWHERDISHSSVERVIFPDATILMDYMLHRLLKILRGLVIHKENIARNLEMTGGIHFSGHVLLALVDRGMSREEAYQRVQRAAHEAWDKGVSFQSCMMRDRTVQKLLTRADWERLFDVKNYLKSVEQIYERVLYGNRSKTSKKGKKKGMGSTRSSK